MLRCELLDGSDACVTPVLEQAEAAAHPHNLARGSFLPSGLPRPAPLLSRTPAQVQWVTVSVILILAQADPGPDMLEFGCNTAEILAEQGYSEAEVARLIAERVAEQADPPPAKL